MINRLHIPGRWLWLSLLFVNPLLSRAQFADTTQFFIFNYPGPSNIPVNGDCKGFVNLMPTPTVTAKTPGALITVSYYDSITTGVNNNYPPFLSVNEELVNSTSLTIHWQVSDNLGHSHNFSFPISFNDLTPPVFSGLPPATLNLLSVDQIPPVPVVTALDNCTSSLSPVMMLATAPPARCLAGSFTRTWTSTDAAMNTQIFTQTINIAADVTGPTITVFPQNGSGDCQNALVLYQNWLISEKNAIVANDLHGVVPVTYSAPPTIGTTCGSTATAIFSVTDECGNATNVSRVFTVTDATPPVFTNNPSSFIGNCDAGNDQNLLATWIQNRGSAVATDACAPVVFSMKINGTTVDSAQIQAAFVLSKTLPCAGQTIDNVFYQKIKGIVTVEFVASDGCNATSKTAVFAVQDTDAPFFTTNPTAQNEPCDGMVTLADFIQNHGGGVAEDQCSAITWTATAASPTNQCGTAASWVVEFLIADGCANTNSITAQFSLFDNVGPVIAFPINPVLENCGGGDDQSKLENFIENHGFAVLSDNCSAQNQIDWQPNFVWVTSAGVSGSGILGSGPYPQIVANDCNWHVDVEFGAADDCGNISEKIVRFKIQDLTAPAFSFTTTSDTISCEMPVPPVVVPTATDNCDLSPMVLLVPTTTPGNCAGEYLIIRTWSATDDCGNSATATQIFVVIDTTGPVFSVMPMDTAVNCGQVFAAPTVGNGIEANDACTGAVANITSVDISTKSADPGVCAFYSYTITRIFTANDACGNSSTFAQTITVQDTTAPVFLQNLAFSTTCDNLQNFPAPIASDACGGAVTAAIQSGADVIETNGCADNYFLKKTFSSTDLCGNTGFFTQITTVLDTVKPTLTGIPGFAMVGCGEALTPPVIGTDIVGTDNCDPSVTILFNEISTKEPSPAHCNHYNYWITREWLAVDNCQNSRVYTQTIQVEDMDAPVMALRPNGIIPTGLGQCAADVIFDAPLILRDDCTATLDTVSVSEMGFFQNTSGLPDNFAPVDDLVLNIQLASAFPDQPVVGPATVQLDLTNFDGEQPTEYFQIFGENNFPLGTTSLASAQCGNATTTVILTENQMNDWGQDGFITIKLVAVGDSTDAVNNLCPGGSAAATMTYSHLQPEIPVALSFTIDGGPVQNFPLPGSTNLAVGEHILVMTATDCSGNATSATQKLTIVDVFEPTMAAPVDQNVFASDTCRTIIELPFPQNLADNCGFSGSFDQNLASKQLVFHNDPNAGLVPNDITLTFTGAIANAITSGTLSVPLLADNGDLGEFFSVFDENNLPLGQTNSSGTAQCNTATTTNFTFSAAQINQWAADGTVQFFLKANTDATVWADFINPCGPLNMANSDGQSTVAGRLKYEFAPVFFEIKTPAGTVVKSGQLAGNQTVTSVPAGQYEVFYSVTDRNGLTGSTVWNLEVRDTTRPVAVCAGSQIYVNPSGVVDYQISPQMIDGGSTDNCTSALNFSVSPATIPCSAIGSAVSVMLTVTDESGNSATCPTIVSVNGEASQPTFLGNICQNDTLKLFANAPDAPANVTYNYLWTAPNGTQFTDENPVISAADLSFEGGWTLQVTGLTGCQSTGILNVDLTNTPAQPSLLTNKPSFCNGDAIVLETQTYLGQNPTYFWYSGQFPGGTLLGTTIVPQFLVPNSTTGSYDFYVMVRENGCLSAPSVGIAVAVFAYPSAPSVTPGMSVCEGLPIVLGTNSGGASTVYSWTGPNGFVSNQQLPPAILSAKPVVHEGIYQVVISENGCPSAASTISVEVKPRPATPAIGTDLPKCTGQTVQLVSNVTNAEQYIWFSPLYPSEPADTTIAVNGLTLANAQPSMSGAWRVLIIKQGCPSDTSAAGQVLVKNFPSLSAANNGPLCEGDPAIFTATTDQVLGSNFHWTGPTGFNNFSQNPTQTMPTAGVYNVTVTNDIGCSTNGSTTLSISPKPIIADIVTNAPICENAAQNVQLQALISPIDPTYIYSWTGPNGFSSAEKSPILNGATAALNGSYTLFVNKILGANSCISNPKSVTIGIVPTPKTPSITPSALEICAGQPFSIFVSNAGDYPGNSLFIWTTPIGQVTTTTPNYSVNNSNIAYSGNYSLEVQVNGCKSGFSPVVNLVVHEIPAPPLVTTNSPVCEGDEIMLKAPLLANTTYSWVGPNSFTSSLYNPVIPNAQLVNAGAYFIKISRFGCESSLSEPIVVVVKPRAAVPTLSGIAQICLDAPGTTLQMAVNQPSQTTGATYNWFEYINPQNSVFILSTGTAAGINYSNLGGFSAGNHLFTASADLNGCKSAESLPFEVSMFEIPANKAFAGLDQLGCTGADLMLAGQQPTIGTGVWTQFAGQNLSISNPNAPGTPVSGNNLPGVFNFIWTLSNGACKDYSADTVGVSVNDFEQAVGGGQIDTCFTTIVGLNAIPSLNGNGFWTQPQVQALLGVSIVDPTDPQTQITGLTPGNIYTFSWNLPDQGCGATTDDVLVRVINSESFAGTDRTECSENACLTVTAAAPGLFEMGVWSSPDPAVTFSNPTAPVTDACGLQPSQNILIWTLNNGVCGDHAVDTLFLTMEPSPAVVNDVFEIDFGNSQEINVVLNDFVPNSWTITADNDVSNGRLTEIGNGIFTYQPNIGFVGGDQFLYTVCNTACADACSSGTVALTVKSAPDCDLPTIITPNNDNVNDVFFVPCINGTPSEDNEVSIFNEWGDEVFHAKPYRNNWAGEFNGQPLPAGTYFYLVRMNDAKTATKGFLVIQR